MSRNNLLEQDYNFQEKEANEFIVSVIWAFLVFLLTISTAWYFFLNYDEFNVRIFAAESTGLLVIAALFIYLILKFLTTALFCCDNKNIKFKLLESKYMPICFCREAFRTWQAILIYLIPLVTAHAGVFLAGFLLGGSPTFVIMLFIMEFFMCLDLTLVLYIIYIKIRYNPDYIAVNYHVYNITMYSRAYVKLNKRIYGRVL